MVVEKSGLHPEVRVTLTAAAARLRSRLRQPLEEAQRNEFEASLSQLEEARERNALNQESAAAVLREVHELRKWAELCNETARAWPNKSAPQVKQLRVDMVEHRKLREVLKKELIRYRDALSRRNALTREERALRNFLTERLHKLD